MKAIYVVLISLFISAQIYSQSDSSKSCYALSFGISNNFTLTNLDADIAVKKVLDNSDQIRLLFSPRVLSTAATYDKNYDNDDYIYERTSYSVGIGADYLWNLVKEDDFQMFGGSGVIFSLGNNLVNETNVHIDTLNTIYESWSPVYGVGLRGSLGVEWKVSKRIGIHCEYLMTVLYNYQKLEEKETNYGMSNPVETETYERVILGSRVLFGLSVYL
jgi:hypothetical protein